MIGAPRQISFDLVDQTGRRFTHHDLAGHYSIVYFGFLNCRVVCPRSLAKISETLTSLQRPNHLKAYYISVDPKRDTPAAMKTFLEDKYPLITGLTGTETQIASAKAQFRVFAEKRAPSGTDDQYDVPHTAFIYLLDDNAEIVQIFADISESRRLAEQISAHLA